jgi:hypothetical protein
MVNAHAVARAQGVSNTRIRFGTHADLPAIARLIHRANEADRVPRIDDHELELVTARSELLVLELPDRELAAAACVAPGRGLIFLVIDPDVATPALEHRMIGVADALSESELGVASCTNGHSTSRARGRR